VSASEPPASLRPPERLLCGPGPTNVDPRVLAALAKPILGHLDPDFLRALEEVVAMLHAVFRRSDGMAFALSSTGTAGADAGIAALVGPGDTVVVGVAGYFGERLCEMARRHGAEVVKVEVSPGASVPVDRVEEALRAHPEARLLALVHAETSTGVEQPLDGVAALLAGRETLLVLDCVTSLGGVAVEAESWGADYCFSCSQKCIGAPPGLAPVCLSERALARIRGRSRPVSFVFDFELLASYWTSRPPVYHHTAPVNEVYALHEALRLLLEEGLEARFARHADAGAYLQEGLRGRGLELLADPEVQLPQLTAVRVPEGRDGREVQRRLLLEHGIEIGGSLVSTPAWRIGLMGANAERSVADRVLDALDAVLAQV
jgi:alanine-glyoxylate transaminase / serine-glyoxylate transaminase / serine-pyruvate transaminase